MEAIEELSQLSDSMRQASALLADEDVDETSSSVSSRRASTFLNVVALGNTVNAGAGKSAVLNSLIGHPALPTGEGGATRALRHSLQERLSKSSGKSRDEIYLKLRTCTAPPLKLIDLPGVDKGNLDDSLSQYAERSDAILLVVIPASQAPEVASAKAIRIAKELDGECTRTVGIISKIDQASSEPKVLAAVQALLLNQGPRSTSDIPWVALIGQSVSIASAQSGSVGADNSLETAWRAESESLKSILTGAPQSKLGRLALVETLAHQIRSRMKVRLPNLLSGYASSSSFLSLGFPLVFIYLEEIASSILVVLKDRTCCHVPELSFCENVSLWAIAPLALAPKNNVTLFSLAKSLLQGKSQIVQDELVRLGEQMVHSAEGTRALALELCREFEDKFLQHIMTGEGGGWKVVASFEGNFPNRIKQLPLDRHFDINNIKRIVLEADGYQPYLISPEKGLRSLIKGVLELAKEPSRLCVDEVHRVLVDIVAAAANATPGLGRYPPFKREVVAIATNALEGFKNDAKNMVVALVDMERAFVPPQHFIRLVQRRMDRQRREEELKGGRSSKKALEAEQPILNRATSPQTGGQQSGGSLKSMKDNKSSQQDKEKDAQEGPALKTAGPEGEITAGLYSGLEINLLFLLQLGYTKKQEERHFRGVITLETDASDELSRMVVAILEKLGIAIDTEECNLEEVSEDEEAPSKSSKDKKANGPDVGKAPSLVFKIISRVQYKTVLKAHSAVVLKAESMAEKTEWLNKLRNVISSKGGQVKSESGPPMRQSLSDGSLDTMARKPADPEEELRWMAQEVRGYVEAVLNSLAANVPKAVVLCQVEKSKEDMLNKLYSSISAQSMARIEELLQEDQNVKGRRQRYQKQSSLLSKLTRQLSIHDNRAAAASSFSNGVGAESSPTATGPSSGDDWRSAFDAASNGPTDSYGDSRSNGHSRDIVTQPKMVM
ncbi:hypothetical protein DH2020_007766 [Rehmannia glutinosa]|uniref:dynamin GTPase n=1 Tax=Rehmannia glutinosa TaxID=99300 RepID=A0ABR0TZR5_REHGL